MRRIIAILAAAVFIVTLMNMSAFAKSDIVVVFNDRQVTLPKGSSVILENSTYYCPIEVFTDNNVAGYLYEGTTNSLVIYAGGTSMSFDFDTGVCTTEKGETFKAKAFYKDGYFYVPVKFVAERLDYKYSYLSGIPMIRIKNSLARLSDNEMVRFYQSQVDGQNIQRRVYLGFAEIGEAFPQVAKILKENKIRAVFFFTAEQMQTQPRLVLSVLAQGHGIGIIANRAGGGYFTPQELTSQLDAANQILYKIARIKTRIYAVPSSKQDYITIDHRDQTAAAGYRIWSEQASYNGTSRNASVSSQIADIFSALSSSMQNSMIMLKGANKTDECLGKLIDLLISEGFVFDGFYDTVPAVNMWYDVR